MVKKEKIQLEIEVPSKSLVVEHARCPNGHLLNDDSIKINGHPALKVKVQHENKEGLFFIDPVYGSYNNIERGISIPKGAVLDLFCPECGVSLKDPHDTCSLCASPMFVVDLPNGGIVEACLKKGCIFHKLKIVDAEEQISRMFQNDTLESFL